MFLLMILSKKIALTEKQIYPCILFYLIHTQKIKKKNDLKNIKFKENNFITDEIYKDGNCFYRAISSFFCGTEEYHLFFRNLIYDYIMSDYDNILISFPYVYFNGKTIDIDEYIPMIKKNGHYAGDFENYLMSKMLNINILILEYKENHEILDNSYFTFVTFFGNMRNEESLPLCILEYQPKDKHYQLLYYDNNRDINDALYIDEINADKNIKTNSMEQINVNEKEMPLQKKENFENYSKNIDENNILNDLNNLKLEYNKNIQIKDSEVININRNLFNNIQNEFTKDDSQNINEYKIEITKVIINTLISFLKDEYSKIEEINKNKNNELHRGEDYPIYPLPYINPEEFYADIYNYLYFRKLNNKNSKYPKYILETNEDTESKKRAFRLKAEKYEINKDNMLCYIKFLRNKNNNFTSDDEDIKEEIIKSKELEKAENYRLYIIPYKINEFKL